MVDSHDRQKRSAYQVHLLESIGLDLSLRDVGAISASAVII
jgi:hypothetical protein